MLMIESYIPTGSREPITAKELQKITGACIREITAAIQNRRRAGVPICAKRDETPGYFIAETADELRDYCGRLKHEEAEIRKTRRACEKLIRQLPGEEKPTDGGRY